MQAGDNPNIIRFPGSPQDVGALQIRVELVLMPTPVWRRLLVPGSYTFWDLHVAIQDAMGWRDKHLHQFALDDPRSGERVRLGIPDESGFHGSNQVMAGWDFPVTAYLAHDAPPALYTYDFGDDWQHEVALEQVLRPYDTAELPICLAGEGICPPEDCGGVPAWSELAGSLEAVEPFAPDDVVFDSPRERWHRAFGHD